MLDNAKVSVQGFLEIKDVETGIVLLKAKNSPHPENMALALARSLANKSEGPIQFMAFGSGGTSVNGVGVVSYLPKNLTGINASLYNQTYQKIIDDNNPSNSDPLQNFMRISHVNGNLFTDITCVCTLGFGEPAGQSALDDSTNLSEDFVFDELGLISYSGQLLTHVIFSPIQKSSNRVFEIRYTIRITLV